jgi:hypothetical protein
LAASDLGIERAIETHAATAHESLGARDFVRALCSVCFAIRDTPMELNRDRQQFS